MMENESKEVAPPTSYRSPPNGRSILFVYSIILLFAFCLTITSNFLSISLNAPTPSRAQTSISLGKQESTIQHKMDLLQAAPTLNSQILEEAPVIAINSDQQPHEVDTPHQEEEKESEPPVDFIVKTSKPNNNALNIQPLGNAMDLLIRGNMNLNHLDIVEEIVEENTFDGSMSTITEEPISYDKGIIMCLHDGIVDMGKSLIQELRCLGNHEIIQVYHCFPDELSELSREILSLNESKLQFIDVCTDYVEKGIFNEEKALTFKSYWIKPLALYHTNISEVILFDADVIAMRDPAIVRTTPRYQKTGTMFFYDRVINKPHLFNRPVKMKRLRNSPLKQYLQLWVDRFDYGRFNLTGPAPSKQMKESYAYRGLTCHEQDSSLVFVDKRRATKPLEILWYMITEKRFRYKFSWGDKEAFWLSWEFSHTDYSFSPWGVSGIESSTNQDHARHPNTMCGNMAHWLPVENDPPELLYINGKALMEPYPLGVEKTLAARHNRIFNVNPHYLSPRQPRGPIKYVPEDGENYSECLAGLGSTPLPDIFYRRLLRRRLHLLSLKMGFLDPLRHCDNFL